MSKSCCCGSHRAPSPRQGWGVGLCSSNAKWPQPELCYCKPGKRFCNSSHEHHCTLAVLHDPGGQSSQVPSTRCCFRESLVAQPKTKRTTTWFTLSSSPRPLSYSATNTHSPHIRACLHAVLPALQRCVQCRQLGNGDLEQSATTPAAASALPPLRDKSHSDP